MKIRIYQINLERDGDRIAFQDLESLSRFQQSADINCAIYDRVYEGDVDCATLEDVFQKFNLEHPPEYIGRSLSVSDIVEVVQDPHLEPGFYFCGSIGLQSVEFDPALAQVKEQTMRVVICEPGKLSRIAEIQSGLESLQQVVGGYIEPYYGFEEEVCIICNEEGKLIGLPPNRMIYLPPEPEEMTYVELCSRFRDAERSGQHLTGHIIFTEDSFTEPYSEESRTYVVSSSNKAFQPNMGGYSIYGSALDGSDPLVRLERYMAAEHGGEGGWKIERCRLMPKEREPADIIFGTFLICDCSGSEFGSLTPKQAERYAKEFRLPERFSRSGGEIQAIPYHPDRETER